MQASSIAARGLAAAAARFDAGAQRTVRASAPAADADLVGGVVEQISAKHDWSANLRVLETADAMTKQLLDLKV